MTSIITNSAAMAALNTLRSINSAMEETQSHVSSGYRVETAADNAAYWIGESLFSQQKYREAIAQFDSVVTQYPRSDKVPGALLKKGFSYLNINERAQGIVQLQYVVHEHPNASEAALARQRLRQLGIETR